MEAEKTLEAEPISGTSKLDQGTREPDLGMLNEEYEASQLLDVPYELEEGELESEVDEDILDEPEAHTCFKCKMDLEGKTSHGCLSDEMHNFCNPCTYESMMNTKYCPSGGRCKFPGAAAPWHWHKDVVEKCSRTNITKALGNVETFQCPACALHCATKPDLALHQMACEPPTKQLDRNFLSMIPTYEPKVQGPRAMKNWHLKSSVYRRPAITSATG